MHIHPAVNYVIVSYVIVNDVISTCCLVMESDSDTNIFLPFMVIRSPIAYV